MICKDKILLFTDSLGAGGAQRQLVGLADLLKKNYRVKVCYYYNFPFYKSFLDNRNIINELIPYASLTLLRIPSFLLYVRKEKPSCIISYQETPSVVASVVKLFWPHIIVIVSERNSTQVLTIKDKIRFYLYNYVDYIVSNSYTQSEFVSIHYPHLNSKIKTIVNFVDIDYFHPEIHKKRNTLKFIVVSSIIPSKNTIGLINAIKILVENEVERSFIINWFGYLPDYPSDYLKKCRCLISQYKLESYIVLHPKKPSIVEEYQNADVLCLPSFYEGTPNAICEGMACGLPIICSNVCDNGKIVKEGSNGYLFDPLDSQSIVEALKKILYLDERKLIEFSEYSRRYAEQKFDKQIFVKKYEDIIKNIDSE